MTNDYIYVGLETAKELLEKIRQMRAIYSDKTRCDWFEADDIARDVAESVGDILEASLRKTEANFIYRGTTFFKDEEAFKSKSGICYIPENAYMENFWDDHDKASVKEVINAGVENTGCFTYQDILNECNGSEVMADFVFDLLDWTYPSTLIDDLDDESLEYIAEREKQISQEKHPRVYVIPASIKWRDTGVVQTVYFSETCTEDLPMDDQIFFCGVTREELLASSGELSISDEWDVLAVGHREPWHY